jgi:hypothetical protein
MIQKKQNPTNANNRCHKYYNFWGGAIKWSQKCKTTIDVNIKGLPYFK